MQPLTSRGSQVASSKVVKPSVNSVTSVRVFLLSGKQRKAVRKVARKSPEKKGSHGVHGGFFAVDISIVPPGHAAATTASNAEMS
jgi:hypothetical protein